MKRLVRLTWRGFLNLVSNSLLNISSKLPERIESIQSVPDKGLHVRQLFLFVYLDLKDSSRF